MAKGWAILWVMVIHAQVLGQSPLFVLVVNRATLVFLVLFGVNSELWWRRREDDRSARPRATAEATEEADGGVMRGLPEWYYSRARRLLPPMWLTLAAWWLLALSCQPKAFSFSWVDALRQVLGWWEGIPTGWFITAILQLAALFPFLHLAARRMGALPLCLVGVAGSLAVHHWWFTLFPGASRFQHLVFPLRFLGDVTFGLLLSAHVERLGKRAAAAAALVLVPLCLVELGLLAPQLRHHAAIVADLPLTVLLLAAQLPFLRLGAMSAALVWLGQRSYGLYLAQLITYFALVHCIPARHLALGSWGLLLALVASAASIVAAIERLTPARR